MFKFCLAIAPTISINVRAPVPPANAMCVASMYGSRPRPTGPNNSKSSYKGAASNGLKLTPRSYL